MRAGPSPSLPSVRPRRATHAATGLYEPLPQRAAELSQDPATFVSIRADEELLADPMGSGPDGIEETVYWLEEIDKYVRMLEKDANEGDFGFAEDFIL